nr:FMN-binding protein [uncultured Cetobacterium sp.]
MKKILFGLAILSSFSFAAEVKEGVGLGYADDIKVSVTMDGDKISKIEVIQNSDTPGISNPAIEKLTAAVIEAQSTDVDVVAGATYTSEGFLEAVNVATGK